MSFVNTTSQGLESARLSGTGWQRLVNYVNQHRFILHLLVILSFGLLALAFTWPLALRFNDTIPGQEVDTWQTFWHFQWTRDAFLSFQNPYFTTRLFYPEGTTLLFETMSITNDIIGLPIQLIFGTFITYNALVIFTFALSGYSMWLLVGYLTKNRIAAYVAGFIFAFAPYRMAQALNHLHLISTQWIVLYIYCLWRALDTGSEPPKGIITFIRERWKLLLAVSFFLILNIFNDWYYVFFLLIFTGLLFVWRLFAGRQKWRETIAGIGLAGGIGLLVGAPLIIAMLIRARTAPDLPFPKELSIEFSADLLSYFTPSVLHPLWGDAISQWVPAYMRGNPTEKVVFLGYVTVLLIGLAALKKPRQSAFWLLVLATFMVLSLGPELHINGLVEPGGKGTSIKLPFALLNETPLAGFVRIPSRFGVLAAVSAAVLAGLGFARLVSNLKNKGQVALAAGAIFLVGFEFWTAPFLMANNHAPAVYSQIAKDSRTEAIIELPLQRNAWDFPRRMYFATIHGKNILQGYTSRIEANPLPPENMPGVRQILFNDMQPDITYDDSKQAALAFFDYYGLGYLVIDDLAAGSKTLQNVPKMINQLFGEVQEQKWPSDNVTSYRFNLGNSTQSLTQPLLVPGANWNVPEKNQGGQYRWMGTSGRLLALIPAGGAQNLKIKLTGMAFARARTLALKDDKGHELARLTVNLQSGQYESNSFSLPAGENWLSLESLDGADSPAALAPADKPSTDKRLLSVLVYKLNLAS
ncbi:MAG TPA: hypothetical protein VH186_18505 [Chloroflexia bacterium]|nr:hypothetical protein [Chloroflexia bacterium]